MQSVIVLGAHGQDGRLISARLLDCGYRVVGVGLEQASIQPITEQYRYRSCDIANQGAVAALLDDEDADAVVHLAAVHASAANNTYEPVFGSMVDVNVKSLHTVLEHARTKRADLRVLYAGSAKCFGDPLPPDVDETTPRLGRCLYAITKNAAASLVEHYRLRHGVSAGVLYLFNHESVFRPAEFFIPKVVRALANAKAQGEATAFHTLDFYCDWGSAEEYMSLAVDILTDAPGEDFIVATGRTEYARDLVGRFFRRHGLDAERHVFEAGRESAVAASYQARTDKLRDRLGRVPLVDASRLLDTLYLALQKTAGTDP